jgi:hypothetical protein
VKECKNKQQKMLKAEKTKKYFLVGMIAVFVLSAFLVPNILNAQVDNTPDNGILRNAWENFFWFWYVDSPLEAGTKGVVNFIVGIVITIFGVLFLLSALLLNYSITLTIVEMSNFIRGIGGIYIAWQVIRDLANIAFIFGIAYIAISTILQIAGKGIRELLIKLIIAALLINFSFFFTGVLIDASNILTLSIYQEIADSEQLNQRFFDSDGNTLPDLPLDIRDPSTYYQMLNVGIAGVFMERTALIGLFEIKGLDPAKSLAIAFFGSIFIFMLTFAFLTIAVLLFVRLIVLTMLIITSPVAYLGWAFPGLKQQADEWWKTLWGQLLFAPAYMVMTLVVVKIITDPIFTSTISNSGGGTQTGNAITIGDAITSGFSTGTTAVIVNYLIIIGLLMFSIISAKKFASQGGTAVSTWVGKAGGLVDNLRGKTTGALGRYTVGATAAATKRRLEKVKEGLDEGKYKDSNIGKRLALRAITSEFARGVTESGEKAKFGSAVSYSDVLEKHEKEIKKGIKDRSKDPEAQARYFSRLDNKEKEKVYIEELSPRARAAIEENLTKDEVFGKTGSDGTRSGGLRSLLSVEDREKTEKAEGDAKFEATKKVRKEELGRLVEGAQGNEPNADGVVGLLNEMGDKEIKGVKGNVFTRTENSQLVINKGVLDKLNSSDFSALQNSEKLTRQEKRVVGEYVWSQANENTDINATRKKEFQKYLRGPAGNQWANPQGITLPREDRDRGGRGN